MPQLSEIRYSRDECVAAVRDYYQFLAKMYLDESVIIEPPEGGWPTIDADSMRGLGKTDKVISLLRHLPYIVEHEIHGAPYCFFADWHEVSQRGRARNGNICKITSEIDSCEDVPASVIGLTMGGRYNPVFLLDTELGVVYWYECPGEIRDNCSREPFLDDAYDYAAENEADWRAEGAAWAVADFFEVLKDQFRQLHFVPISPGRVHDVYTTLQPRNEGMLDMVQEIYRQHGWPNLERYRKQECLEHVHKALKERYPHYVDN